MLTSSFRKALRASMLQPRLCSMRAMSSWLDVMRVLRPP